MFIYKNMLSSRGVQQQDCLCMQWDAHRGDCLCSGMDTGEICSRFEALKSTICCTTWRLSPQYDAQHGDCLRSMMHNVEVVSAVWCTTWRLSPQYDAQRGDWLHSGMHTSEIDLAVCFTPWIEYLREIETKLKNTLACLSGARLGLTHEINGGRKSRDTLPIKKREIEHYNKLSEPVFF